MESPIKGYVIIDTETGGLPNSKSKAFIDIALTEIACVTVNSNLEITNKWSSIIKPYKKGLIYSELAEKVSGLGRKQCEEKGKDVNIVLREFIKELIKAKEVGKLPIFVAHNTPFDAPFIVNMFEFCKEDLFKYIQDQPEDTLRWSRMLWTESTNYKLGTVCENANITLSDAHHAITDAEATAKLWIYFLKNLRGLGTKIDKSEEKRFRHTFEL